VPTYTDTYPGCAGCCQCPLLKQLSLRCPTLVPAGTTEFCFKLTVASHTITGIPVYVGLNTQWVPPATFSIIGKAIQRCSGNSDLVNLIPATTIPHPQDPVEWPHMVADYGQIDFQTNGPGIYVYIPFKSSAGGELGYTFDNPSSLAGSLVCSPFSQTLPGMRVSMHDPTGHMGYGNILGSYTADIQIETATCPGPTAPSPVPFLTQATQPCVYLGNLIEDPVKCGCGTANLMECRIYGTCRRTGTATSGERVCITCSDYKKA
jgi:hypothetical protein